MNGLTYETGSMGPAAWAAAPIGMVNGSRSRGPSLRPPRPIVSYRFGSAGAVVRPDVPLAAVRGRRLVLRPPLRRVLVPVLTDLVARGVHRRRAPGRRRARARVAGGRARGRRRGRRGRAGEPGRVLRELPRGLRHAAARARRGALVRVRALPIAVHRPVRVPGQTVAGRVVERGLEVG